MRLYTFNNFYLSSLQQGLQSAHVTHELFIKYNHRTGDGIDLWEWAENHKTMILLNGGMASDLIVIEKVLALPANPYPWAAFREEEAALNNSITSVGVVLPSKIYDGAAYLRTNNITDEQFSKDLWLPMPVDNGPDGIIEGVEYTPIEARLMSTINRCGLAR